MKTKENKPINHIPVPGVGMFSTHPSKFKLSSKPTSVEIQEKCLFKHIDYRDIMDLKKLYFKGWLLSR